MSESAKDLPPLWRSISLSEALDRIEAGKSPKAQDRPALNGELGVLKLSAVTWNTFRAGENKALLPGFDPADCPRVRKGDLLISRANTSELIGAVVQVPDDYPNLILSDKTLRLVPRSDVASASYLLHVLRTPAVRQHFERHATGTSGSMRNISQENIKATRILLPPLREQRRIAAILDKADAIRRKREEGIRLTEELLRSTFLNMFGDPAVSSREWPTALLGTVCQLDRGRSRHRPRDEPSLYGGPYPFIQTGDVSNSDGYISQYSQTYSEAGLAQSKIWPEGTLCITIAANIAKTAILSLKACFPDSVVGLVAGDCLTIEYVRFWFVAMEKVIDAAATQVAQKNINLEILDKLPIPLPPLDLQKRFSKVVQDVYAIKRRRSLSLKVSNDVFDSLIQRTFRGEL